MAFQWIVGNDYGGLNAAGEQAGQNATSNWFRQAQMVQGLDQQARAEADAQQQQQQKQAEVAAQWAWTKQQAAQSAKQFQQQQGLEERKFAWAQTKDNPVAEKRTENLIKLGMEQIDSGKPIDDSLLSQLPKDQQDYLRMHSDRVKQLLTKNTSDVEEAAKDLNRNLELTHYLAQSAEDQPGYWTTRQPLGLIAGPKPGESRYAQRERMSGDVKDWTDEQKGLADRIAAIKKDPELMAQLRMNADGRWQPHVKLPWAAPQPTAQEAVGGQKPAVLPWTQPAAVPLAGVGTPQVSVGTPGRLPPKNQLVAGQTYQTPRGPAIWDGEKFTAAQ